ncbi:hypothetical protein BKA70DRAFT_1436179 [Coprinopsis sp. MPI-PUGE-AT-0042]|nr:hypothetical protein BKA70DRAFT_1436179 [Coprinopsis sp. MPI-PUGE-AT-0042]
MLREEGLKVEPFLSKFSLTWRHIKQRELRLEHYRYVTLKEQLPDEIDFINCTNAVRKHIVALLKKGQSFAWRNDLRTAKEVIQSWLESRGEDPDADDTQGRLLCPIGCDWNDAETRDAFQNAPQEIAGGSWPVVLYQNLEYCPSQPWEGFLRNNLLLMIYRHVFAANSSPDVKPNNRQVTSTTIVYISTLVVIAIAKPKTYAHGIKTQLFDLLTEHLYRHKEEACHKQLLQWWRQRLEGAPIAARPAVDPPAGMLARLRAAHAPEST